MRILAMIAFFLASFPAYSTDFNVSVWSYSPDVSQRKLDAALAGASEILTNDHRPGDVPCPTLFKPRGIIHDGSMDNLPKSLDSKEDMVAFRRDGRFSLYVVRSISVCGNAQAGRGQFIAGCSGLNGGPVVVSQGSLKSIVVGHEFGHAQGLLDEYQTLGLLMYYIALPSSLRVTRPQCSSFEMGQVFAIMEGDPNDPDQFVPVSETDDDAVEASEATGMPLGELMGGYWHQIPTPAIAALTESQLELVRQELNGEASNKWQNAVTILGLRGNPNDADLLSDVIDQAAAVPEAEVLSGDVPWLEIQGNAQLALGLLYNRTQDSATLGLIVNQMTVPESVIENAANGLVTYNDISKNAAQAFALAGPIAAEVYPNALNAAEILSLLRNNAVDRETPILSTEIGNRLREEGLQFQPGDTVTQVLERLNLQAPGATPLLDFQQTDNVIELVTNNGTQGAGSISGGAIYDFYNEINPLQPSTLQQFPQVER